MIYIIKTINGQKVAVPLTADTGSGNPVGTIIAQYKKTNMAGYLYLDGRDTTGTADELETVYPALYAYLGNTNVLPDYREFALVGAEENTTSTNIATHDTYTQGQEKDDQVQDHDHYIARKDASSSIYLGASQMSPSGSGYAYGSWSQMNPDTTTTNAITTKRNGRYGDVTRGKRKAVYFYIKATSGLTESQMDSMITILNQQRSYSTDETDTGKKWIDGKPIYRKVIDCGALPNNTTKTVAHNISNLANVIKAECISYNSSLGRWQPLNYTTVTGSVVQPFLFWVTTANVSLSTVSDQSNFAQTYVTIEYTKSS